MILTTGFLASMHCVGMCGAIVLTFSAQPATMKSWLSVNALLQLLYNGGRVVAYMVIGALIGVAGMTFGAMRMAGEVISIAGGVIMVFGGAAMLGILPLPSSLTLFHTQGPVLKLQSLLLRKRTKGSALAMGLLTPLLPCGILYAMLAKAAATQSMVHGALTMGMFALGTVPALFALGAMSSVISARMRKRAEQLAAVTIMLMGAILILRGLHVAFLPAFLTASLPALSGAPACPNCLK